MAVRCYPVKTKGDDALLELSAFADIPSLLGLSPDATNVQCGSSLLIAAGGSYLALSATYGALSRWYTAAAVRATCCLE
jgi:hypothetical protein